MWCRYLLMHLSCARVDWIPKGPPSGTLTIKPKERCAPRFVTKIEGNAVEEGVKVFFEGIVDAQPQPKFSWYFNDEPIVPGGGRLGNCWGQGSKWPPARRMCVQCHVMRLLNYFSGIFDAH